MTSFVHNRQNLFDLCPKDRVSIDGIPYLLESATHGGMGCILFFSQDPAHISYKISNLGFKLALKAVLPDKADVDGIALFRREMTVWSGLQHPNIVRLLDILDGGDAGWIAVMDWHIGSLRDLLKTGVGLHPADATHIISHLISGLDHCYSKDRVLHLDLKPENVLYDSGFRRSENSLSGFRFMVSDWGIASIKQKELNKIAGLPPHSPAACHTFNNMGTISYMAPERFKNGFTSSLASDVFSLGFIYLEMLVGTLPFEIGTHPAETIQTGRYLDEAKGLLRACKIPKSTAEVILSMVSFNPTDRPSSYTKLTKEFLKAWHNANGFFSKPYN